MKRVQKIQLFSVSVLVLLSVAAFSHAQKDYSRGFKKFYQLGLPDVSGAEYVNLSAYGAGFQSSGTMRHRFKTGGNAWLLEEDKTNGWAKAVVNQVRAAKVYDRQKLMEMRKKEAGESGSDIIRGGWDPFDHRIGGNWKKADLKKDIEAILKGLEKESEKSSSRSWIQHSDVSGEIFLSAAHFHSKGYTNEANQIVGGLFSISEDPHSVIMKGLNKLADGKYEEVYGDFRRERDWKQYHKDMKALLARFKSGWRKAPAVKRLIEEVNARIEKEGIPPLDDEALSEDDRKLAQELVTAEKGIPGTRRRGALWILADPAETGDEEEDNPLQRIVGRGIKSIPLLLAMLKDDYLTQLDLSSLGLRHSYHSYSSDAGQLTEEQILNMYNNMNRPAARSDIAFLLLKPLRIGAEQYSSGNMTKNELHSDMEAWYEENKDKSRIELARLYLKDGNRQQKQLAIGFVLAKGKEEDMAGVEKYLLDVERPMMNTHMVRQYVMVRGKKAAAFVDKYEAALKKSMASDENNQMYKSDDTKKQVEQTIEQLRKLVSAKPADELLASLLSGDSTMSDVSVQLRQKLGQKEGDEALDLTLDAALKAGDGELKSELLSLASQVPHLKMSSGGLGMYGPRPKKTEMEIEKHSEQWKKLLNDQSKVPGSGWQVSRTVAESAAQAVEGLYGENYQRRYSVMHALGEEVYAILVARGKARLEGKSGDELPQFPSADNVSEEDRKVLTKRILSSSDPGGLIGELSLDEKLALAEMCSESEESDKLNKKLLPLTHTINEVDLGEVGGADRFKSHKGKMIDTEIMKDLLDFARKMAGEERMVNCMLWRRPAVKGVSLRMVEVDRNSSQYKNMTRYRSHAKDRSAKVTGTISAHRMHASAEWEVEGKTSGEEEEKAPESTTDELMSGMMDEVTGELDARKEESRKEFWDMAEKFCKGESGNVCANASVYFVARPSIKAEAEKDEEE